MSTVPVSLQMGDFEDHPDTRTPTPVSLNQPQPPPRVERQPVPIDLHMPKPESRGGGVMEGIYPGFPPMEIPAEADVPVIHPDGREGTVPAANLDAAIKLGYKKAQ